MSPESRRPEKVRVGPHSWAVACMTAVLLFMQGWFLCDIWCWYHSRTFQLRWNHSVDRAANIKISWFFKSGRKLIPFISSDRVWDSSSGTGHHNPWRTSSAITFKFGAAFLCTIWYWMACSQLLTKSQSSSWDCLFHTNDAQNYLETTEYMRDLISSGDISSTVGVVKPIQYRIHWASGAERRPAGTIQRAWDSIECHDQIELSWPKQEKEISKSDEACRIELRRDFPSPVVITSQGLFDAKTRH